MPDNLIDNSFGVIDTMSIGSQQLIDAFLDEIPAGNPEDVKVIKDEPANPTAPAKNTTKVEEKEKEPAKPFDLSDLKEEGEGDDEEEKDKEVKTEEKEKDKEEEKTDDYNPFEAFSKELYNLGIFQKDSDEEVQLPSSPEAFLERFNEQSARKSEEILENYLARYGEAHKEAFDAIFIKGLNPSEYYQAVNAVQAWAELDLGVEENQIAVARETFKNLDYEKEDIDSEIAKLKDYGDLENFAKRSHKGLVKKQAQQIEEKVAAEEQKRAQQADYKKHYLSNVNNVLQEKLKTKEFDGIPLNPKLAQEVRDFLTVDTHRNSNGETFTDFDVEIMNLKRPENHELKVKYALLLKLLKADPTLSTIQKTGVSKQTNKLFSDVVRNKPKTNVTTKSSGSSLWNNL